MFEVAQLRVAWDDPSTAVNITRWVRDEARAGGGL